MVPAGMLLSGDYSTLCCIKAKYWGEFFLGLMQKFSNVFLDELRRKGDNHL
jgi:hypothetical protein